jgi:hypothetical protein
MAVLQRPFAQGVETVIGHSDSIARSDEYGNDSDHNHRDKKLGSELNVLQTLQHFFNLLKKFGVSKHTSLRQINILNLAPGTGRLCTRGCAQEGIYMG